MMDITTQRHILVLVSVTSIIVGGDTMVAEAPHGWPGIFSDLPGYQRTLLPPVVSKDKKTPQYRQTAQYQWTGGALKQLEVTVARDPTFKEKFAAETLRKGANPPKEIRVGKRTAWLWNLEKEAKDKGSNLYHRLVVPFGDDKAFILEAKEQGPWENITTLAERFDLGKIEAALDQPPRTQSK